MLRAAFFIILTALVAACVLWLGVDSMVAKRVYDRANSGIPAAYSAPFLIRPGEAVKKPVFINQLKRRGYVQVNSTQTRAGQYRLKDDKALIQTRGFRDLHGNSIEEMTIEYDLVSGEIYNHTKSATSTLVLEPEVVTTFGSGARRSRTTVTLHSLPPSLVDAVIAVEDERFYQHVGVDPIGIARALMRNISAGRVVQGGSTLTQQLAKNLFFSPKKTLSRKVVEAFAALSLEFRYTKEQILEMYLNEVYLGQEGSVALHGVESASQSFFRKPAKELSLAQSAMLAGIIQAPSAYSPRFHPQRAKKRQRRVLQKMKEQGRISQVEYSKATKEDLGLQKAFYHKRIAPFFGDALRSDLLNYVHLEALSLSGVQVHTGFSPAMQSCATQAVSNGLAELEKNIPTLKRKEQSLQVGLVAIEPFSGLIKAWVGGRNYKENQFDHVVLAKRQIGSTIKPFLYLSALDGHLNNYKVATARSVLSDAPMKIDTVNQDTWEPQNYDKTFKGDVTLRYALERSLNLPAVYVAQKIGYDTLVRTVKSFQISDEALPVPSLALGAIETSLLQLTAAFSALANGGRYIIPRYFRSVIDENGETIATSLIREKYVADENAVYVLTNILQGVLERGTARKVRALGFTRDAAGKTGTSDQARDAWFVGYTPTLTTGVWLGYDDNKKIGISGGGGAAPIWAEFMKCAEPYYRDYSFVKPSGVSVVEIDSETGRRATNHCPEEQRVPEVYVRGTEPRNFCPKHSRIGQEEIPIIDALPEQSQPRKRRRRNSDGFWEMFWE